MHADCLWQRDRFAFAVAEHAIEVLDVPQAVAAKRQARGAVAKAVVTHCNEECENTRENAL